MENDDKIDTFSINTVKVWMIGASQGLLCSLASLVATYAVMAAVGHTWVPKIPWWMFLANSPLTIMLFWSTIPWTDRIISRMYKPVEPPVDSLAEPE